MDLRGIVGFIAGVLLWRHHIFPWLLNEQLGVGLSCTGFCYWGWLLAAGFGLGLYTTLRGYGPKD